jgi:hypothetical protein
MSGARIARAALLVAAAGCAAGGSETGNPAVPMRIDLDARSSDPDAVAVAVSSGAAGTVIDEAWVAFGELAFLRGAECAMLGDYDVDGPTAHVADLARAGARLTVEVAEGDYCGLVVPLMSRTTDLPEDAPEELATHSIVLRGRRADGTPFLLTHPEQDELELAARETAFAVDSGAADLLLSFDVAVWMEDVDLDAAEIADGVIRIDAENNRTLLDAFERNLECSLELYADEDDDSTVSTPDPLLASCAPG